MKTFKVNLVDFMGRKHVLKTRARSKAEARKTVRNQLVAAGQGLLYTVKNATL
jgi:hypothetical protein